MNLQEYAIIVGSIIVILITILYLRSVRKFGQEKRSNEQQDIDKIFRIIVKNELIHFIPVAIIVVIMICLLD